MFVVGAAIEFVLELASADVGSDVGDGDGDIGDEGVSEDAVFVLFFDCLLAVCVDFLSDEVVGEGVEDQVLPAFGDPAQIEYELAFGSVQVEFFGGVDEVLGVDGVDGEGGEHVVALLFASAPLHEEATLAQNPVQVHLPALEVLGVVVVEVGLDCVSGELQFSAVSPD